MDHCKPSDWKTALLIRSFRFSSCALVLLSGSLLACDGGAKKELETKLQKSQQELVQVRAKAEDRDKLYDEVIDAARFVSDIQLDLSKARARYSRGKSRLTASELEILRWLLSPPGRAVTRRQIPVGTERAVDVHVAALRSKLGSAGACIETIRGIGYRFRGAACL